MSTGLNIRKDGALDFLSLRPLIHRLDPGRVPFRKATEYQIHEPPEEAIKLGWAHGALLTTYPGDTTMATVGEVRAFAKGGSARIQR
jgi:hypothetical protein